MMIKLSEYRWVAADQIAEIMINEDRGTATIRTEGGTELTFEPSDRRVGIHAAVDKLIDQINGAQP